jgi:hypothetical protein
MHFAGASATVDVVGVGINATDTIIRLPRFPVPDSKMEVLSAEIAPGGQVASAIIACRRWGLSARYVGKIGDDSAGKLQRAEMQREGVEAHWITARGSHSQRAFILVDESSGERTILWERDQEIALHPDDLNAAALNGANGSGVRAYCSLTGMIRRLLLAPLVGLANGPSLSSVTSILFIPTLRHCFTTSTFPSHRKPFLRS